jgi:hypothetical protein
MALEKENLERDTPKVKIPASFLLFGIHTDLLNTKVIKHYLWLLCNFCAYKIAYSTLV